MTSLLCLPVVVCNLGVEMLYVLEQRLRAQSVSDFKAVKVLHDVTRAMFAPEFVNELFTPQPTYSQYATRKLFDKLAHTSIMRLSESSMDKLYDLMTMHIQSVTLPTHATSVFGLRHRRSKKKGAQRPPNTHT